MSQRYFHFTIGPVQGFVAQARRTRDFWAGSFLLSWLSGVAMLAVKAQDGTIEFPSPREGYLEWINGRGSGDSPRQGAIPNRFKATVSDDFDPHKIKEIVCEAWKALAKKVWDEDLGSVAKGIKARDIWERQHANFWEISWILTESEASDLLDRRKNWRSHLASPEPGVKCMVMDGWQELSGADHPNSAEQKNFWDKVRSQQGKTGMQTDLAEGEKLCAVAFVKRRFARHFASFTANIKGVSLRGWELDNSVPSVSYMAAVHWLEAVLTHPEKEKVTGVLEAAKELDSRNDEWKTRIRCLEMAMEEHQIPRHLIARDGSVFFGGMRDDASPDEQESQEQLARDFRGAVKELKLDVPLSPFYAILLMDGDSLGVHMGDIEKQPKIANALNQFTQLVPNIVEENNGFLVYAGGDDVLAILPLEDAFLCANSLREVYAQSFEGTEIPSTLSGAIEFAHVKTPLGRVLGDSHDLLDHVAKEGCGRDAIAVRVWKTGGCDLQWAQPWEIALDGNAKVTLQQLADEFEDKDGATPFSNGFFYKIRERFELLNPPKDQFNSFLIEDQEVSVLTEDQEVSVLAADYISSGINEGKTTKITMAEARQLVAPLLEQCRPHHRVTDEAGKATEFPVEQPKRLKADGALLVRFLAHKGIEPRGAR